MDVLYFLKDRTQFIRQYYETAAEPFLEIMRKIDTGESPFDDLRFYPEDEPPFQAEWSHANTSLEVLGRSCISMLSATTQAPSRPIAPPASVLAQRRSTSRGAALADGIGRLAERFAGLARRSGYPHSETPGAVSPLYRHSAREIRTITERPPDAPRATAWQNA
jgi:hypothetical protein